MYIMCVILCLFSALSRRVRALEISIIITITLQYSKRQKSIAVSLTELVFGSLGHCGGRILSVSARIPDTQTCHVRLPAKRLPSLAVLCNFIR